MTQNPTDRKSKIKARMEKLAAELRAEKLRERRAERRAARRRDKLIAKVTMQRIKDGKFTEAGLRTMMDEYLERPTERALFGLPPRAKEVDVEVVSAPAEIAGVALEEDAGGQEAGVAEEPKPVKKRRRVTKRTPKRKTAAKR